MNKVDAKQCEGIAEALRECTDTPVKSIIRTDIDREDANALISSRRRKSKNRIWMDI